MPNPSHALLGLLRETPPLYTNCISIEIVQKYANAFLKEIPMPSFFTVIRMQNYCFGNIWAQCDLPRGRGMNELTSLVSPAAFRSCDPGLWAQFQQLTVTKETQRQSRQESLLELRHFVTLRRTE